MEYICGLLEHSDTLENLFRMLKNRYLLMLGAPSEDWVVRFFLRVARQQRLSAPRHRDYLADNLEKLGGPMVFFFDRVVGATRIIPGEPGEFVQELARRWRERYGPAANSEEFLARIPEQMPRGAVFISYSRKDLEAACNLAQGLAALGVPVWLDKLRMRAGENFVRSMEHAVKEECSFFLSLISANTESSEPDSYSHQERGWAASRQVDGFVFYLPVVIDATQEPRREPPCFARVQRAHLPSGQISPEFARRVQQLVEDYRNSGRPRG